jgi:mannose-6-phosphate isomerase-like protein (cupin superfamily)
MTAAGGDRVLVIDVDGDGCPALPIVEGDGSARAVVWPGMGAERRSLHTISLGPGARTIDMCHEGEAVYFVREGVATVRDDGAGESHEVPAGRMFLIDPGTPYAIHANGQRVELVGGPSPPDRSLYEGLA